MTESADPLVGDEVISIELHPYHVHLRLSRARVIMGSPFFLGASGQADVELQPGKRTGDLQRLWALVGATVERLNFGREVEITLSQGYRIHIPWTGEHRGEIIDSDGIGWDDF